MKKRGKRWIDVLLLLIVATLVVIISEKYVQLPVSIWLYQQNLISRFSIVLLSSLCLWGLICNTGGIRLNDLSPKSYFAYPSLWLTSVLWGLIFCVVRVITLRNEISHEGLLIAISNLFAFIIAGIVVAICYYKVKPKAKGERDIGEQNREAVNTFKNPKEILEWVHIEAPIIDEGEDLFNHKYIAQKIREILNERTNKNIGIIGGYGSGKSSIINLIISKKKDREIYIKIEGWGFKENAAVEHILQLVIEDLKLHFDCLAIANLPRQYHEAMNSCGSSLLSVSECFFHRTRNPIKLLGKVDSILECVDSNLIIVFENIDRNSNDAIFYNEIAAFLNVTKEFKHISFIVAIGPRDDSESILTKLCEHNEYVQRIDKKEIISICNILIHYWRDHYCEDITIQGIDEISRFLGFPRNENEDRITQALKRVGTVDYVSHLLNTPRKLKLALREVDTLWGKLHGEIDFKSFFLVTVLKACAPEAYTFINEKERALRSLDATKSTSSSTYAEAQKSLMEDWEQITEDVSWPIESVRQIIITLFPMFGGNPKGGTPSSLVNKTVQGFIDDSFSGTDYWKRMNVGRVLPDEISDQRILKAIEGWKENHFKKVYIENGRELTLADAVFEVRGFDDKVEQFGFLLEGSDIRQLASELFAIALRKKGNEAKQELCPGFINLWRLSLKKEYSKHEDWLISEIEKAIGVSLRFASDLYYYWRSQKEYDISTKTPTPELRKRFASVFRKNFEGEPERLVAVLDQESPWNLYHIVYIHREQDTEEWGWLGNVLLNASGHNQKLMASYIACLISSSELRHSAEPEIGSYYDNKINFDVVKEIFGDNTRSVMELLSKDFDYPELSDDYKHAQTRSVIQNAREKARKWLNMNGGQKE